MRYAHLMVRCCSDLKPHQIVPLWHQCTTFLRWLKVLCKTNQEHKCRPEKTCNLSLKWERKRNVFRKTFFHHPCRTCPEDRRRFLSMVAPDREHRRSVFPPTRHHDTAKCLQWNCLWRPGKWEWKGMFRQCVAVRKCLWFIQLLPHATHTKDCVQLTSFCCCHVAMRMATSGEAQSQKFHLCSHIWSMSCPLCSTTACQWFLETIPEHHHKATFCKSYKLVVVVPCLQASTGTITVNTHVLCALFQPKF